MTGTRGRQPLWRILLAALGLGLGASPGAARDLGPAHVLQSDELRTDAVSIIDGGKRREATHQWCHDADALQPFVQRKLVASVAQEHDTDIARCDLEPSRRVVLAPGIEEPTRVCVSMYVLSKGGIAAANKRGHLRCVLTLQRYATPVPPTTAGLDGPLGAGDARAVVVGLPADLTLRRSDRSSVLVATPLRGLEGGLWQALQALTFPDPNLTHRVHAARMEQAGPDPTTLGLFLDIEVDHRVGQPGSLSARCSVRPRFALPAAPLDDLTVQLLGTTADCATGNDLLKLVNVPQLLANAINAQVLAGFAQLRDNSALGQQFAEWRKEDPELGELLSRAWLQGRICSWRGEPALCIAVGWANPGAINAWQQKLLTRVPAGEGPADKARAAAAYAQLLPWALRHQRRPLVRTGCTAVDGCPDAVCAAGTCYLTAFTDIVNGDFVLEDGDLAIFGGIACAGGVDEGCRLLRAVQPDKTRFWRSPWRIGEADSTQHATFSGDQLKGVLHYFSRGPLDDDDRQRLAGFLRYLRTQPTNVPLPSLPLEQGYSSCLQRGPNFTCLIGGDWTLLDLVARHNGLEAELPKDIGGMLSRYDLSLETLVWEALLTNTGYRLHLVAQSAWLLRKLAPPDPRVDLAIRLIAARQPDNPFFLWLLLGTDARVQRLVDARCTMPPTSSPRMDWAWQRADSVQRWKQSMVWDCALVQRLLSQ